MGIITAGKYEGQHPLHPKARQILLDAFDQGWADPAQISAQGRQAQALLLQARESIAKSLGLQASEIELWGEPELISPIAIWGAPGFGSAPFIYGATERSEIIGMRAKSKQSFEISVDLDGAIDVELLTQTLQPNSIVAIQSANIETGVIQNVKAISKSVVAQNAHLHIDATASGARFVKPSYWSTLHFDARSWNGPSGVGVFALKNGARWSNPLPHTKPTRAPNSFSIPLALAAAGALEHWIADEAANSARLKSLIERIRNHVKQTISDVDIAGNAQSTLPNIISLSFLNVSSEQLVAALEVEGFSVASGSACVASALEPSHVLKAMGLLTHGNMRINLNHDVQDGEITKLLALLPGIISKLREN